MPPIKKNDPFHSATGLSSIKETSSNPNFRHGASIAPNAAVKKALSPVTSQATSVSAPVAQKEIMAPSSKVAMPMAKTSSPVMTKPMNTAMKTPMSSAPMKAPINKLSQTPDSKASTISKQLLNKTPIKKMAIKIRK